MRSFNILNRRTRKYNNDGSLIYNTFNSSQKCRTYNNVNPRVEESKLNITDLPGCGKQCCVKHYIIKGIQIKNGSGDNDWKDTFKNGTIFKPDNLVLNDLGNEIGIIQDIELPYYKTCKTTGVPCIKIGSEITTDCSGIYPFDIKIILKSHTSCVDTALTTSKLVIVQEDGTANIIKSGTDDKDYKLIDAGYAIVGSSKGFAPYRAPIAGFRKTLVCCSVSEKNIYKDNYVKSCELDPKVCYDKRIRSGMQPVKAKCKFINSTTNKCDEYEKYSFSYTQYNKNRVLNTYERGLERNLPKENDPDSAIPDDSQCKGALYPNTSCKFKSLYRKSSSKKCNNNKTPITVWKPNNSKFKVQGAVSSGSRLDRLKLETLRSANSKCKRNKVNNNNGRCNNGVGRGKYFAGKPRFTGWMFNSSHKEICQKCK